MIKAWMLVTLCLASGPVWADSPRNPPADEAAIAAASEAFSAAYVRGDTLAIGAFYTEDAVLLPPGRRVTGRANIARYFAPRQGRANVNHTLVCTELRVEGDMAVDVGTWHNTWRSGEEEAQTASGNYLVVWRRGTDDTWRMAYDMWHRPSN